MEQRHPITRKRPAREIVKDLENRLSEAREPHESYFTKTLDLTGLSLPSSDESRVASEKLLISKDFGTAAMIYASVVLSQDLTKQKLKEFEIRGQGHTLSDREKDWGELMKKELQRKDELSKSLNEHFSNKPKKLSQELVLSLSEEIQSQQKVRNAYEKKRSEQLQKLGETIGQQIEKLKHLGDAPVTEYLGNNRTTWLVKSSELQRGKSEERDLDREIV